MAKSEFELVVSEGRKSIFETILASVFFSIAVFLICCTLWSICIDRDLRGFMVDIYATAKIGSYAFAGGLYFATVKTVLIDIDRNKLISRFNVGPISWDLVSSVPQLEYVSVFLDAKEYYEVNLWYNGNKHYKMFCFEEKDAAFKFAAMVADKLKIDQLDATEKGNSKWIEKANS